MITKTDAYSAIPALAVKEDEISTCPYDTRRGLYIYMDYVCGKMVKRTHRHNLFPKADALKLAKATGFQEAVDEIKNSGSCAWLDFIDRIADKMGFINYDKKGEYAGYSSSEPSFPDNYIKVKIKAYNIFLSLSLQEQEERLLNTMVDDYSYSKNEFFSSGPMNRLSSFSESGCATGVLPGLNFAAARRYLLEILSNLKPGVWHSVSGLIQYIKADRPYFLIPRNPKLKYKWEKPGRYQNFKEGADKYWGRDEIDPDSPDAFKRVEGRFIERFLEYIPYVLQYVDLHYQLEQKPSIYPSLGEIKAFRTNKNLSLVLRKAVKNPKIIVLPNFEIHIQSSLFPCNALKKLSPFCEILSRDITYILALKKEKILSYLSECKPTAVLDILSSLNKGPLPGNILHELKSWAEKSEAFTIYENFGLAEGEPVKEMGNFISEKIAPNLHIIISPDKLRERLEQLELAPSLSKHPDAGFNIMPDNLNTAFPKASDKNMRAGKPSIHIKSKTETTLYMPPPGGENDGRFVKELKNALIAQNCPFKADKKTGNITYNKTDEPKVRKAMKKLKEKYKIKIDALA